MTSPQAQLHYRLSDALGGHDPDPDVADRIRQAYLDAGADEAGWDDLPPEIQQLVEQVEALPATSWDDPFDVPEDTDYMDDGPTPADDDSTPIESPTSGAPVSPTSAAVKRDRELALRKLY